MKYTGGLEHAQLDEAEIGGYEKDQWHIPQAFRDGNWQLRTSATALRISTDA